MVKKIEKVIKNCSRSMNDKEKILSGNGEVQLEIT